MPRGPVGFLGVLHGESGQPSGVVGGERADACHPQGIAVAGAGNAGQAGDGRPGDPRSSAFGAAQRSRIGRSSGSDRIGSQAAARARCTTSDTPIGRRDAGGGAKTADYRSESAADAVLDDLIDEVTRRIQAGERVDPEAYASRYPEYGGQIRELLPALAFLAELPSIGECGDTSPDAAAPQETPASGSASRLGTLGDYRIVGEIGRGGMGVVYQAEQISLARRVALKVLPFAAVLDPNHLKRFRNEAQAAASLDHPNVVSIHAVGCDRGVHYYAMQHIEGQTLAQVIDELRQQSREAETDRPHSAAGVSDTTRQWLRHGMRKAEEEIRGGSQPGSKPEESPTVTVSAEETQHHPRSPSSSGDSVRTAGFFGMVARLGIQAAEGLEHAHQLGVVHRDVKPSNLMVDPGGHLWVTDFGLAQTQTGANLTMTGDIVGTLRYMSPEQALADRSILDHRTDVYSLGVTSTSC